MYLNKIPCYIDFSRPRILRFFAYPFAIIKLENTTDQLRNKRLKRKDQRSKKYGDSKVHNFSLFLC